MTDEHKPADYAELLSRAEKETHRSGMWADTCLLIDELAAAIRSLIGERDDLAIKLRLEQSSSTFAHIERQKAESLHEAAEARASELEKALNEIAYKRCEYTTGEDHARAIWTARAALARKGEG